MKYKITKKKIKYEDTTELAGTELPCYVLESGERVINEKDAKRVFKEVISSVENLALTSLLGVKDELLKSIEQYRFQRDLPPTILDIDDDDLKAKKADLDKILDACINISPLAQESLRKARKRKKGKNFK